MTVNGCYRYQSRYLTVDITLDCSPDEIDWFGFSVPEDGVSEFRRAAPFLEQYFNGEGTERLCEPYDEPEEAASPTRVIFFLEDGHGKILETPYGNIPIDNPLPIPAALKQLLYFEKPD